MKICKLIKKAIAWYEKRASQCEYILTPTGMVPIFRMDEKKKDAEAA